MRNFLILFFSFLLFSSCNEDFQELTFSGIESVRVIKMSREGVEAEISAKIKNPNSSSFKIYKSELDVTLNGINCGKANITNNVKIKGNSEKTYVFKIRSNLSALNMADLPKVLSMAMSKNAKVGLKGNLRAGKFLIKKDYPIEYSKTVNLEGI